MARWTIELRHDEHGWEWREVRKNASWWGYYETEARARSAAKRATTKVTGGKTDPADFEFVKV